MRVGRVVRRVFLFSKRFLGRENEVAQPSMQPTSDKRQHYKKQFNIYLDLPFLFSMRMFLMNPLTGEYHLLDAKTCTFSNSDGLEFLVENTLFPPIEMK